MRPPKPPKQEEPEKRTEYRAHQNLVPQVALLLKDAEEAEHSIEELRDTISEQLEQNSQDQADADKAGDTERHAELVEDEKKLRAAYASLGDGIGRMNFGDSND